MTPREPVFDPTYAAGFVLYPHQHSIIIEFGSRLDAPPGSKWGAEVATGGGKTAVAAEHALAAARANKRVLVLTPNVVLAKQFLVDVCARHQEGADLVCWPRAQVREFPTISSTPDREIVVATTSTWNARRDGEFVNERFDVVVVDEIHWGEERTVQQAVEDRYASRAVFFGVTATPRAMSQYQFVDPRVDMASLVAKGLLPRPVVHRVETGVSWAPGRLADNGDFAARSLAELAASNARNRLIVETFVAHQSQLGRTLVFACNIEHTECLATSFGAAGVRAAAYHSKLKTDLRDQRLAAFRSGALDVLVNVNALSTGVDVPEIATVILARPTTSDILHAQMIGRGARRAPGKTEFHIVDLVDAIAQFGAPVVRPTGYFGSAALPPLRGPVIPAHEAEVGDMELFGHIAGHESLWGLPVSKRQTFGIEFEIRLTDWGRYPMIGEELRLALATTVPTASSLLFGSHAESCEDWVVKRDGSCGIEITSRVLRGVAGFAEVHDALRVIAPVLERHGLGVDIRTGTHVHLGWRFELPPVRWLISAVAYFEPALLSLIAPSRAQNMFAHSVYEQREQLLSLATKTSWRRMLRPHASRYSGVNLRGLFHGPGTAEIRWHSGTLEARKILAWTGLWQYLIAAAEGGPALPGNPLDPLPEWPLALGPRGDITALGEFLGLPSSFIEVLRARRHYVLTRSWVMNPRYRELARRALSHWGEPLAAAAE